MWRPRTSGRPRRVGRGTAHGPRRGKRGLTLLELSIAMAVLAVVLSGVAMGLGASLKAVEGARRVTGGTAYLESVMQNVAAQPYANLLPMNGNQFFDQPLPANSNFRVDLTVFNVDIDLVQIDAQLVDLRSGRPVGTVTTQRCSR